jgi:hypothetical protein
MTWRLAKSLEKLRTQVNAAHPKRSKASDGSIGDEKHASRDSDHNPWVKDGKTGVVTAIDITNDPANGCDAHALADHLRTKKDPRIKYVISNGRIFSSTKEPWKWRTYTGSNKHVKHMHISVSDQKVLYDDVVAWSIS